MSTMLRRPWNWLLLFAGAIALGGFGFGCGGTATQSPDAEPTAANEDAPADGEVVPLEEDGATAEAGDVDPLAEDSDTAAGEDDLAGVEGDDPLAVEPEPEADAAVMTDDVAAASDTDDTVAFGEPAAGESTLPPMADEEEVGNEQDDDEVDELLLDTAETEDGGADEEGEAEGQLTEMGEDTAPATQDEKIRQRMEKIVKEKQRMQRARVQQANAYYATGRRLYDDMQYGEAEDHFEKALEYYPNHTNARKYLARTRSLLGRHKSQVAETLKTLSREKRVQVQELQVELDTALREARELHRQAMNATGDGDAGLRLYRKQEGLQKAIERYERVLEIIRWMPYQLDLSREFASASRGRDDARREKAQTEEDLRNYQREQAKREKTDARDEVIEFHRDKIEKLTSQAQLLFRREKYQECEDLCMEILKEAPNNLEVSFLFKRARARKHDKTERWITREAKHNRRVMLNNVAATSVPYDKRIIYPDDWERILMRADRGLEMSQQEESWQRDIRAALQRRVSFEFVDTPLREALQFLQGLTNTNIILDPQVQQAGDTPITLRITNMSLELALDWILRLADLDYALRDDALFISTGDRLAEDVVMKIYDVADLTQTIQDFPGPDVDMAMGGGAGGGAAGGAAMPVIVGDQMMPAAGGGPTASSLSDMIRIRVRPESWDPALGTSIEEHGNKLIVLQRPEVHRLIQNLLASLRSSQKLLVTVEARFLEVREGFFEEIGVNWNGPIMDATAGSLNNPLYNGGRPSVFGDPIVNPQPVPWPGTAPASLNVPVISSDTLSNNVAIGMAGDGRDVDLFGRGVLYTVGAVSNNFVNYSPENTPIVGTPPDMRRLGEGLNASITHLGNVEAQAMIHMLRIREAGTQLSAPRLTMFNTQRAHMFVAEQTSYISDYEITGDSYDPVISQFLRGIIFDVRPIVSADRKYITLELQPTSIDLLRMNEIVISTLQTMDLADGDLIFTVGLPLQFPELQVIKVRTTATIPDGGILLIGGLMRDIRFRASTGIPLLANLPVLGRLFRWDVTDTEKSNMVIMVTARVLMFDEEERKLK